MKFIWNLNKFEIFIQYPKIHNFEDELFIMSKYDDPNQPKLNTYFKELKDKEMVIE